MPKNIKTRFMGWFRRKVMEELMFRAEQIKKNRVVH